VTEPTLVGLSDHPQVAASIRRAKSVGGLVGFALVLLLSQKNSAPFATACFRATLGGAIGYLVAWSVSVVVWRHVLRARTRAAIARATARRLHG
jgi:uncharacterized membrane protein YccC